jgi:micrococcal nuclease
MELYNYKARVVNVVDGDTVKLDIDLGFYMKWRTNCRLSHINADELRDADPALKESAFKAKEYLETVLKPADRVLVKSTQLDKYKRPVVQIITESGLNVNEDLVAKGHAKPYLL